MSDDRERTLRLGDDPSCVAAARDLVSSALHDWGYGDRLDEAVLAVSEVAGNAVAHGRPPVDLHVTRESDRVVVSVVDHDPACVGPSSARAGDEGGRGLAIVEAVSDDWGCAQERDRKQVWFAVAPQAAE